MINSWVLIVTFMNIHGAVTSISVTPNLPRQAECENYGKAALKALPGAKFDCVQVKP